MKAHPEIQRRRLAENHPGGWLLRLVDIEGNGSQRQGKISDRLPFRLPCAVTALAAQQHRNFKIGPRGLQVQRLERDLEGLQALRKRALIKYARSDVLPNPVRKVANVEMGRVFRVVGGVVEDEGSWRIRGQLRGYGDRNCLIARSDNDRTMNRCTVWHSHLV